mgnify:CR=1 FL=1
MIHIESDSLYADSSIVARGLEEEADYLEKNADEIEKYYAEMRKKAEKEDGGSNGKN